MQPGDEVSQGERSYENGVDATSNKPQEGWTLENSSLWWLSFDLFQNPGKILLMTSIPFCAGAYYGYARPGNNLEEWVSDLPKEESDWKKGESQRSLGANRKALEREAQIMASRQLGLQVATRALGIATLGTVGTFGLLTGSELLHKV